MRITVAPFVLVACLQVSLARAQSPAWTPDNDGGISYDSHGAELLESITVPNIANAPFSLILSTEWAHFQSNGGTFTTANSRPIVRDRLGRIYTERWLLAPKGSGIKSRMSWIQIEDPVANTFTECSPIRRVCTIKTENTTPLRPDPALAKSGPINGGKGNRVHEDLGKQYMVGLPVHGYRETITLNPGVYGNDLPLVTTREFFYSTDLGITLRSVYDTPAVGRQTFSVTEINTNDPDPKLFQPPSGYQIIDTRKPAPLPN